MIKLKVAEIAKKNKNWKMSKLAKELEMDPQTVMYWNQGRSYPRFPTLVRLCRLLECSLDDLIGPINA